MPDFSLWIDTPNMEYFSDGRGAGARRNFQWDEGEQLPDESDVLGPGVIDGGIYGVYDEFAAITQRHYYGIPPGTDPADEDSARKVHSAYQAYFELEPPRFRDEWAGISGTRIE